MCLLKEEIKSVRNFLNYNFDDCFDNKNGNIITSDRNEIALWKRYKKSIFVKSKFIEKKSKNLRMYDISDTIFCSIDDNNGIIYFYEHENFQMRKTITIKEEIEFVGVIKNKLLCIEYRYNENFIFIDLKHFEIVLKTYNDKIFDYNKVMNDFILQFRCEKEKLIMKKYIFNFIEGNIEDKGTFENNIENLDYLSYNILLIDDCHLILFDYDYFNILKI